MPSKLNKTQGKMVEEHLWMAEAAASEYPWEERAELIAAGHLALCESALTWDKSRGVKFSTYAYRRVNGAVVAIIRERLSLQKRDPRSEGILSCDEEEHVGIRDINDLPLEGLPKLIVWHHIVLETPLGAIAESLGISTKEARELLQKGLENLRAKLHAR